MSASESRETIRRHHGPESPLKVVIVNKSDTTGGAAVVSRRLMEALRLEGVDARMLVVEKLTSSPYVTLAASRGRIKRSFLSERLKIFLSNGLDRDTLFRIDTASDGLPLWRHPLVVESDAILLNWVNQGMLSLKGVEKILELGKPVIWTMHDMWCMTGVCHHAGECEGYKRECGHCPLFGRTGACGRLPHRVWLNKLRLGENSNKITYVAVSNWLAGKCAESSLLCCQEVCVVPNAFHLPEYVADRTNVGARKIRILFGAARLDDPVKGLPTLVEATRVLLRDYPHISGRLELVTFGGVKDPSSLEGIAIPHRHLGMIKGEGKVREVYESAEILVSASSYETLPGTLVEAQAYGCIPVSFNQGGQSDIVGHLSTGYLAEYTPDIAEAGRRLAQGIAWAVETAADPSRLSSLRDAMRENVESRFSASSVAQKYIRLIEKKANDLPFGSK